MDIENFRGLKQAAEILLERLKEKDYKKWLEVVMFSPPELIGNYNADRVDHEALGQRLKALCDSGKLSIRMSKDGVVRGHVA